MQNQIEKKTANLNSLLESIDQSVEQNRCTFAKDLENQIFLLKMKKIQSIENSRAECKLILGNAHNQVDFAFKNDSRGENFLEIFSDEANNTLDRIEGQMQECQKKIEESDLTQRMGNFILHIFNFRIVDIFHFAWVLIYNCLPFFFKHNFA